MSKYKAVIFDMDGVLIDSEIYYANYRKDFFKMKKIDTRHLNDSDFIGANIKNLWKKILQNEYSPSKEELLQSEYTIYKSSKKIPYGEIISNGVGEVLEYLKKKEYKVALATSSSRLYINRFIDYFDYKDYFDVLLSGDDCKNSKPNPELYLLAIDNLKLSATDCLVIEDSENGILAAKRAKCTVWAVKDNKFKMNQDYADDIVPNIAEIIKKLEDL